MANTSFLNFEIDTSKAQEQLNAVNQAIAKVKEQQEKLNEAKDSGTISEEEYNKQIDKTTQQLEKLTEKQKTANKAVEEENSLMGRATSTAQSLGGAGGQAVQGMMGKVQGLNMAVKALIANPIIAVVTAIIGVFMTLKNAISNNEESQNKLNLIMAKFEPIINLCKNALDALASGLLVGIDYVGKFVEWWIKAEAEIAKFIAKFTGIGPLLKKVFGVDIAGSIDKATASMAKASEQTVRLEKETQNLEKMKRDSAKNQADINNKIADLQEDLADKESLSYKERMDKTKQLTELRKQALEEENRIAKEELRIAQEKASLAPNSKADNDELAKLQQKVADTQSAINREVKKGNKLVANEQKSINAEIKATRKAQEDAKKERLKKLEEERKERQKFYDDTAKETAEAEYQNSLLYLNDLDKAIAQFEHTRKDATEKINEEIKKASKYGNTQLVADLQKRLENTNKAIDKQIEDARKKSDEKAKKDAEDIAKRSQDLQNRLAQAELKGKTGIDLYQAELKYNQDLLKQKYDQDLLQQNLTNTDKLALQREYELKRQQLAQDTDKKIADYQKKQEEAKRNEVKQTLKAYQTGFSEMGTLVTNLQQLSDESSKSGQALARVSIALQMALAMANGIQKAMEQSFPINLIAAASTVAELAVMFQKIKSVKSEKMRAGGLVGGVGSGTSDSNRVNGVQLSRGESVINANGTRLYGSLLSSINTATGGQPIRTANNSNTFQHQLQNAMMSMPHPVVSVNDINKGQDRYNYVKTVGKATV